MYPDWDPGMDPGMAPARSGNLRMANTPNLSPGLLGQAPMGGGQQSGRMGSGWGGNAGNNRSLPGQVKRSRVVVAKYDRKPLNNTTLFALAEPFGILRENLVLKNKAFLEMDTHQQAQDMVQYYQQNRASMCNQPVHFYLSKDLMVIEKAGQTASAKPLVVLQRKKQIIGAGSGSQVVFFSNVPREEEKKMELLTIAGNFGTVEKHLFLSNEAFVQLGSPEDAEMLVKYYTLNPLTINGQPIRLNICTKYKTLNTDKKVRDNRGMKNTFTSSNNSPGNRRSSSPGNRSSSKSSKSSSRRRERERDVKKREETKSSVERDVKKRAETKSSADKEETKSGDEEVSGVVEGEEEQGEEEKQECEEEEKTTEQDVELQNPEEAQQHPDGDPVVTTATNGEGDGDEAQEKEAEPEAGPSEKAESIDGGDKTSANPEESQMNEGEMPDDMDAMEDFPDNMDDFVTLDELMDDDVEENKSLSDDDYIDNTRKGGMRVVNVGGFRKGYGFLDQILRLAKPFGKVVKHLVLDLRPEAYIQFGTEEEAKAMVRFYNAGNIQAAVCDKHVKISHSQTYPTIKCGASRVVYLGQLPDTKFTDEAILKIAETFGKVKKYFLNRIKRECFVEMENPEVAEKMADKCKINPPKLHGKRLTVYVSRKYKQLKHGHRAMGKRPTEVRDRDSKKRDSRSRSRSRASLSISVDTDEPPTKKPCREEKTPDEDKKEDEGKGQEEELKSEVEMKGEEEEEEDEEVKEEESTEEQKEVNANPDSDSEQLCSDVVKQEEEEVPTSLSHQNHSMDSGENQTPTAEQTDATAPVPADATTPEHVDAIAPVQNDATTPEQTDAATPVQVEAIAPVQNDATTPVHTKPAPASLPLDPYDENNPVGLEFVKMGYYCRLCFLFYSNEETAKKIHCSSQTHYDKLKKHLEKNRKGKKTE